MDKKQKQRRQKSPSRDELADANVTPPGASFDTKEGRAAQGMRPDLGGPADDDSAVRDSPVREVESADDGDEKRDD